MQVNPNPNPIPNPPPRILIADNDLTTLETLTEYFQKRGNIVFSAPSLEATETLLGVNDLDAAIFDGRLTDEDDGKDSSGWDLAERTADQDNDVLIFVHSRVAPTASPFAGRARPNIFEIPKLEGIAALGRSVDEEIKKKRERNRTSQETLRPEEMKADVSAPTQTSEETLPSEETTEAVAAPILSKQHKALVALIALLLTLICGFGAVLLFEPKLLVAAIISAIVAVVFITMTLD